MSYDGNGNIGESDDRPDTPVWANEWTPHVDRWDPNADTYTEYERQGPGHGDLPDASPMSDEYGQPTSGSTPDARANLLTDVRRVRQTAPPIQVIRHEVITSEAGAERIRARTVMVTSNAAPTVLLDANPNRKRALIKVITSNQVIMVNEGRAGYGQPLAAVPTANATGWAQATGDPMLEVKSQAMVEAYGAGAVNAGTNTLTTPIAVTIWEEIQDPSHVPGGEQ